jgi:hypothetical protein
MICAGSLKSRIFGKLPGDPDEAPGNLAGSLDLRAFGFRPRTYLYETFGLLHLCLLRLHLSTRRS